MTHKHGTFVLLQDGLAQVYAPDFETIELRLREIYAQNPAARYLITQVVGTVDKPAPPVIHSVYRSNS